MRLGGKDSGEFDDPAFLTRLRQGDPAAYRRLIRRFHTPLVRIAAAIIGSQALGEDVVQDSWMAVHAGIGRFEGRSSLATWLFSIVLNRARSRAARESRLVSLVDADAGGPAERAVPLSAFQPDGHWVEMPRLWDEISPERVVGGRQLWDHVQAAIERLPAGQRAVLILRDVEQCAAEEACALLNISAENQRVLLHRARGRIRATIDSLVGASPNPVPRAARHPVPGAAPGPVPGTAPGPVPGAAPGPAPRIAPLPGAPRRPADWPGALGSGGLAMLRRLARRSRAVLCRAWPIPMRAPGRP